MRAHTRASPRSERARAGAITRSTKTSRAAATVASCSCSFEPKSVAMPLLLWPDASASRPMVSPSRPSTDAVSIACARITRRDSSPRTRRPSSCCCVTRPGYRTIVRIHTYDRAYISRNRSRHVLHTLPGRRCGAHRSDRSRRAGAPRSPCPCSRASRRPTRSTRPTSRRCGGPSARPCGSPVSIGPRHGRRRLRVGPPRRRGRRARARLERTGQPVRDAGARTRRARGTGSSPSTLPRTATRPDAGATCSTGSPRSARFSSAMGASPRSSGTRSAASRTLVGSRPGRRRGPRRHGRSARRRRSPPLAVPGDAGLRRPDGGRTPRAIRAPLLPGRATIRSPDCRRCGIRSRAAHAFWSYTTRPTAWCRSARRRASSARNPGAASLATSGLGHSRILRADPFLDAVLAFVTTPGPASDATVERETSALLEQDDVLAFAG